MSSEVVVQKENENGEETAVEVTENTDIKENCVKETTVDCALKVNSEELNGSSKELSESENKENEEPSAEEENDDDGEDDEEENVEEEEEEVRVISRKHADEFLSSGKRHLLIGDFQAAADDLSTACGIFVSIYGEMAEECAETYFNYGCALLELSKKQTNPVEFEDDGGDKSVQEENSSEKDENSVANEEKADEVEEKPDLVKDISKNGDNSLSNKETSNSNVSDDDNRPHENDFDLNEVNDLQIAWEMLDLAKIIYKKKNSEVTALILAEVLMKCGEVSIEDEKFDLAIADMTESLMLRRLLLPEDSRIIAETLFNLGLAHELAGCYEKAINFLNEALDVLEQRIKNLENSTDDKLNEGVQIKAIIPEIRERINDIKERKRAAIEAVFEATKSPKPSGETSLSTVKPASNISHLVRKRPKQEETDETPNKILKLESTTDKQ